MAIDRSLPPCNLRRTSTSAYTDALMHKYDRSHIMCDRVHSGRRVTWHAYRSFFPFCSSFSHLSPMLFPNAVPLPLHLHIQHLLTTTNHHSQPPPATTHRRRPLYSPPPHHRTTFSFFSIFHHYIIPNPHNPKPSRFFIYILYFDSYNLLKQIVVVLCCWVTYLL